MTTNRDYGLAGERMRLVDDGKTTTISFTDDSEGRVCGGCTLCCKLLPIPTLNKAAGQRCRHQRTGKGCAIYADRPMDCRAWACRWLIDARTAALPRPDRAHYVIDMTDDHVTMVNPDTGERHQVGVLQIWIDPAFPDAHRDPKLRAWLDANGTPALIRFDARKGMFICPPSCSHDREWHEVISDEAVEREHPIKVVGIGVQP